LTEESKIVENNDAHSAKKADVGVFNLRRQKLQPLPSGLALSEIRLRLPKEILAQFADEDSQQVDEEALDLWLSNLEDDKLDIMRRSLSDVATLLRLKEEDDSDSDESSKALAIDG